MQKQTNMSYIKRQLEFSFTVNGKFKIQKLPNSFLYKVYFWAGDYKYANDVITNCIYETNTAMRSQQQVKQLGYYTNVKNANTK